MAAEHAAAIDEELAAIRVVHAQHRSGAAFRKLHVRTKIPAPLAGRTLTLAALGLDAAGARRAIALGPARGPGQIVTGGFAAELDGCAIYGRTEGHVVVALGLGSGEPGPRLAAIARAHALVRVDWLRATCSTPDGDGFVPTSPATAGIART